jgi:hypothetical protein
MADFNVIEFMENMEIYSKHPEIFKSGMEAKIKKFIKYFVDYTKYINNTKKEPIANTINKIKKDFNIKSDVVDKLLPSEWNEKYFGYCATDIKNDIYVYPLNVGSEKIHMNQNYLVNCIKLGDIIPDSLELVNRNGHMMLAGNSKDEKYELGKGVSFKIIFIYNHKLKKWLVVPFKIVSKPTNGVLCDSFSLSATTDDINRQYTHWAKGLHKHNLNLGVLNLNYFDESYKSLENLFSKQQTTNLLTTANNIINNKISGGYAKKSIKKINKKASKKSLKKSIKKSNKK